MSIYSWRLSNLSTFLSNIEKAFLSTFPWSLATLFTFIIEWVFDSSFKHLALYFVLIFVTTDWHSPVSIFISRGVKILHCGIITLAWQSLQRFHIIWETVVQSARWHLEILIRCIGRRVDDCLCIRKEWLLQLWHLKLLPFGSRVIWWILSWHWLRVPFLDTLKHIFVNLVAYILCGISVWFLNWKWWWILAKGV